MPSLKSDITEASMKILNREPTEEMIRAACLNQGDEVFTNYNEWFNSLTTGTSGRIRKYIVEDFQAMYDAAPDIKVDMEPVAYGYRNKNLGWYGCSLVKGGSYTEPDRAPLYSSEQVASLQAENERLKKDCEYNFALYQDMGVKAHELAAERDELLDLIRKFYAMQIVELMDDIKTVFAKYEGGKHE